MQNREGDDQVTCIPILTMWFIMCILVFGINYCHTSSKPLLFEMGPHDIMRVSNGDTRRIQDVYISIVLFTSKEASLDIISMQLVNSTKMLRSSSLRRSGYNVYVDVEHVIDDDTSGHNITYDNFLQMCDVYVSKAAKLTTTANLVIIASNNYGIGSSRGEFIAGMSNNRNCLMYSVHIDTCGIVLFHEIVHTIFKVEHVEACSQLDTSYHVNVMAAQYKPEYCSHITSENLFSGLECDFGKSFENSRFGGALRRAKDTSTRMTNVTRYVRARLPHNLPASGVLSEWSDWYETYNGPIKIRARSRECLAYADQVCPMSVIRQVHLDINKCSRRTCLQEVNDLLYESTRKSHHQNRSCVYYNGCLRRCNGNIDLVDQGQLCGDGVCDGHTCIMFDTLQSRQSMQNQQGRRLIGRKKIQILTDKNFYFNSLRQWVEETRVLLKLGPPQLRFSNNILTCFGTAVCQQAREYLRANKVLYKTLSEEYVTASRVLVDSNGNCLYNEYVCEKYLPNYRYGRKFLQVI